MESLCKDISERSIKNEDEIIEKLTSCLDNGGDINYLFLQEDPITKFDDEGNHWFDKAYGTVLHYSITNKYERVVQFALDKGADIVIEMTSKNGHRKLRGHNALEISAAIYNASLYRGWSIFEMMKKRSLELYSPYGLLPVHLHCATHLDRWDNQSIMYLLDSDVKGRLSARISAESPLWPGMTSILIAAKLSNVELVEELLKYGADPLAQDSGGNSVLHYIYDVRCFCQKLFAPDGRDTIGSINGESHFHMACRHVEYQSEGSAKRALDLIKRYLDQGISPDLPIKSCEYKEDDDDAGKVGLHLAAKKTDINLIRLLLEHGADVNKEDSRGRTPVQLCIGNNQDIIREFNVTYCLCMFIEAGSNQHKIDIDKLFDTLSEEICLFGEARKRVFLSCIKKLTAIDKKLVSKKLMNVFHEISNEPVDKWDEADYASRCKLELKALFNLGLHQILDGTIIVARNFKDEFEAKVGRLDDKSDFPIYGSMLKLKFKRKLLEFEEKRRKIPNAIPKIQKLFQSLCHLPDICSESILWNLSEKELGQFVV